MSCFAWASGKNLFQGEELISLDTQLVDSQGRKDGIPVDASEATLNLISLLRVALLLSRTVYSHWSPYFSASFNTFNFSLGPFTLKIPVS